MKSRQILSAVFALLALMLVAGCPSSGGKYSSSQSISGGDGGGGGGSGY